MPVERRTNGQNTQVNQPSARAHKPSIYVRLRYAFDNAVAQTSAFMTFLLVGSAVLSVFVTWLSYANGNDPLQDARWQAKLGFWDRLWFVFTQVVFGGGKPDGTNLDRLIAAILWVGNVIFTAFLFSFVTVKIFDVVAKIQKGRSNVIDSNHTLILGWSNRVFPLLSELNTASEGKRKTVVILASQTRAELETEIETRCGILKNLKLVTRSGDIENPVDLKRVKADAAKSIILLDSDSGSDAVIVASVLAIKAAGASHVPVVAEFDDPKVAKSIKTATNGQVIPVRSDDIIARVTAQATRQNGLAAVVLDLLDFAGDEIYFTNVPALVGKTYAQAQLGFNDSAVIGIISAEGVTSLNPAPTSKLVHGDRLIVIAKDDTKVVYTGTRDDLTDRLAKPAKAVPAKPANLLVIGWSFMGEAVLNELAGFLPKGSSVDVVVLKHLVSTDAIKGKKWGNLKVSIKAVSGDVDELVSVTKGQKYDEIILLGYRGEISSADADAHTMLTMLHINQMKLKSASSEATRLVVEILDSRKADLARFAAEGDLVISDNLGALLIAQLSENPALAAVFDDLFDAGGASILVKPITDYAATLRPTTFADLVAAASDRSESAVGYLLANRSAEASSPEVILNPNKTESFTPQPGDSLIVVGKL
jgi:K+/H+ antiporter YhaU regulatory subunit KhtT